MRLISSILFAIGILTTWTSAADTAAWKTRNVYFALMDRISRGRSDENGQACDDLGKYCGGTFKGLESKLDYIKGMGFDALWVTPVVASMFLLLFLGTRGSCLL